MKPLSPSYVLGYPIEPLEIADEQVLGIADRVDAMSEDKVASQYFMYASAQIVPQLRTANTAEGDRVMGVILGKQFNNISRALTNHIGRNPRYKPEIEDFFTGKAEEQVMDRFTKVGELIQHPFMKNALFLWECINAAEPKNRPLHVRTKLSERDKILLLQAGVVLDNQLERLTDQYPEIFNVIGHFASDAGMRISNFGRNGEVAPKECQENDTKLKKNRTTPKYTELVQKGFNRVGFTVLIAAELTIF